MRNRVTRFLPLTLIVTGLGVAVGGLAYSTRTTPSQQSRSMLSPAEWAPASGTWTWSPTAGEHETLLAACALASLLYALGSFVFAASISRLACPRTRALHSLLDDAAHRAIGDHSADAAIREDVTSLGAGENQ